MKPPRCWWMWISSAARTCGAFGHSCATAGWTPTRTLSGGLSIRRCALSFAILQPRIIAEFTYNKSPTHEYCRDHCARSSARPPYWTRRTLPPARPACGGGQPPGGGAGAPALPRRWRRCCAGATPIKVEIGYAGSLTGLVHGGDATPTQVIVSLERMRAIEEINPTQRTATVQAGVTLQALQEAVEEHHLMFPLDLGARGTATLGGNAATNAGGNGLSAMA